MKTSMKKNLKKGFIFLAGGALLVFGVALMLHWWAYVEIMFRGIIGLVLALLGIFILAVVRE